MSRTWVLETQSKIPTLLKSELSSVILDSQSSCGKQGFSQSRPSGLLCQMLEPRADKSFQASTTVSLRERYPGLLS